MSDGTHFRIDLPGAVCAIGTTEQVNVWRSAETRPGSLADQAVEFAKAFAETRGLVALALDTPHDDDRFHGGCLASLWVEPKRRIRLIEENQ